jgi:hypothetical protein
MRMLAPLVLAPLQREYWLDALAHAYHGQWKIDLFRFKLKFVEGNLELEKEQGA